MTEIYVISSNLPWTHELDQYLREILNEGSVLFVNRESKKCLVRGEEKTLLDVVKNNNHVLSFERYLPPWIIYPDIPRYDIVWQMGMGYSEDYWRSFWICFNGLSLEERALYQKCFPEPEDWEGVYTSMTKPQKEFGLQPSIYSKLKEQEVWMKTIEDRLKELSEKGAKIKADFTNCMDKDESEQLMVEHEAVVEEYEDLERQLSSFSGESSFDRDNDWLSILW